jgi:gas vesicle protein
VDDRTTYPPSLLTFLLGGLAGASIALLFAPQSGRDTRRSVSRRMRDGVDAARDLGSRVVSRGRDMRDEASRTLSQALDDAERSIDRAERDAPLRTDTLRSTDTTL